MIKGEGRLKTGRKTRVVIKIGGCPEKGCKLAHLLVPIKPDFHSSCACLQVSTQQYYVDPDEHLDGPLVEDNCFQFWFWNTDTSAILFAVVTELQLQSNTPHVSVPCISMPICSFACWDIQVIFQQWEDPKMLFSAWHELNLALCSLCC